jgi:hypothetical protein
MFAAHAETSARGLAPTEVVFTPLNVPYFFLARFPQKLTSVFTFSAQLLQLPNPSAWRRPSGSFPVIRPLVVGLTQASRLAAKHPIAIGESEVSLLHSSLVQVLGATRSEGIKNPDGLGGTSGRATELFAFQSGAALAPRCCPFPVSSTVSRLLMRRSRNAPGTIRHPPQMRQLARFSPAASPRAWAG